MHTDNGVYAFGAATALTGSKVHNRPLLIEMDLRGVNVVAEWVKLFRAAETHGERTQVLQAAKAVQSHFEQRWRSILQSVAQRGRPVMYVYMSDGWSRKVWRAFTKRVDEVAVRTFPN